MEEICLFPKLYGIESYPTRLYVHLEFKKNMSHMFSFRSLPNEILHRVFFCFAQLHLHTEKWPLHSLTV